MADAQGEHWYDSYQTGSIMMIQNNPSSTLVFYK